MKRSRNDGKVILTPNKLNLIIDCGFSYTNVKRQACLEYPIKRSYIDTDFINEVDACSNIYGVIKDSNITVCSKHM